MNELMSLIVVKDTQHVLAALTCNAKTELTAEAVAGSGLLVRGFLDANQAPTGEQFRVPADKLDVVSVEHDQVVLLRPRDFVVEEVKGKKEVKQPGPITASLQMLDAGSAQVDLDDTVDVNTTVFLHIDGGNLPSPRTYTGTISKDSDTTTIQFDRPLGADDYSVMILVAGSSMVVEPKTIP